MTHLKGDGFYLVGVDIAPGKWQSTGTKDGCYWERSNAKQDILGNHFGFAGGTVFVHLTDFQIEFDDCGAWIYVEGMEQVLADDATEPKRDGFYTVGVEIEPGQWRSSRLGPSKAVNRRGPCCRPLPVQQKPPTSRSAIGNVASSDVQGRRLCFLVSLERGERQ